MNKALIALAILLEGCAVAPVQSAWLAAPTHPELRPYHVEVSEEKLARTCGDAPGLRFYGCAVRIPEDELCIIYTRPGAAPWVMEHERKHCAGWDHD